MARKKILRALKEAIKQSDMTVVEKLRLRLILAIPFFREAVIEFVESELGDVSSMSIEEIIKFIIEHLPEILAFIEALIGLFG